MQRPSWLPTYLPELDGLRGLAVLGVVLFHYFSSSDFGARGTALGYFVKILGWAGPASTCFLFSPAF